MCERMVVDRRTVYVGGSIARRSHRNRHQGSVKFVDRTKGYGFIKCHEVHEAYGSDVFVLLRDLLEHDVGDCVRFSLKENSCGKPQGTELEECKTLGLDGKIGCNRTERSSHLGTIKSFDTGRGHGFINCSQTFRMYGRDVFVHKDQVQHFQPGDKVSFIVRASPSGHPQAFDIKALPRTLAWLATVQDESQNDSEESLPLVKHTGEVKSINAINGYGFIACAALLECFGCDVFFPISLLGGLAIGERVEFQARMKHGKLQAQAITRVAAALAAIDQSPTKEAVPPSQALTRKLLRACASARKESYDEMFVLLSAGADPNGRDVTGQFALMISALNDGGGERKCRLLVGMGADVHLVYREGLTVLQWARERLSHRFAAHLEALSRGEQIDCLIVLNTMGSSDV